MLVCGVPKLTYAKYLFQYSGLRNRLIAVTIAIVAIVLCSIFKLVIANVLQTRKNRVLFVTPTNSYEVHLTREQTLQGLEIEELIVADVVSETTIKII